MNEYDEFENGNDDRSPDDESLSEREARLRRELDADETEVRAELAEVLMQQSQKLVEQRDFEPAISYIDEAIALLGQLIDEGEVDYREPLGRCRLFHAMVVRFQHGFEAGLTALNEVIRLIATHAAEGGPGGKNLLAVALMNKAELLNDPLGAHAAAIASQDQAVRIWQSLAEEDGQFRIPLVSATLSRGDSKVQSGDSEAAIRDFLYAIDLSREGLDDGETPFRGLMIQSLGKLSRLYEQIGDLSAAFASCREAIELVESFVRDGDSQAEGMLSTLCLHFGMLFERAGDSASALAEYERCRDVYLKTMRDDGPLGSPGDYLIRTGLANVLMCRGNMLVDQKRFDEARESFDESIRQYRQAAEYRPENDADETFIPYSVGVVQLNCANMLVLQGKLDEALQLKEEAMRALHQRIEAGHQEILPNLLSAYRRMVGIQRLRNETETMFDWTDKLISLLREVVDEGKLEYRDDLGAAYHLRGVCRDERKEFEAAESDYFKALRLFRELADDDIDSLQVQQAKFQWGEILYRLAFLYAKQKRFDDGVAVIQRGIDDVLTLYHEGNKPMIIDVMLGFTQLVSFIEEFLENESLIQEDPERAKNWGILAIEATGMGIELCEKAEDSMNHSAYVMFAPMKIAFFKQHRGFLLFMFDQIDQAVDELQDAADRWLELVRDSEQRRFQAEYLAREAEAENRPSLESGTLGILEDRFLYYSGELRQTLSRLSQVYLARENFDRALQIFRQDAEFAEKLIRHGTPFTDRFFFHAIFRFVKEFETVGRENETIPLFCEAVRLMQLRIDGKTVQPEDLALLRFGIVPYLSFFEHLSDRDGVIRLMESYTILLEQLPGVPDPESWKILVDAVDFYIDIVKEEDRESIRIRRESLRNRFPNEQNSLGETGN